MSGKRYPWGDEISKDRANYNGEWDYSFTQVGAFAPNGYGLYDMSGNAWEWCWDWIGPYTSEPRTDPHGPETYPTEGRNGRCVRGGALVFSACLPTVRLPGRQRTRVPPAPRSASAACGRVSRRYGFGGGSRIPVKYGPSRSGRAFSTRPAMTFAPLSE